MSKRVRNYRPSTKSPARGAPDRLLTDLLLLLHAADPKRCLVTEGAVATLKRIIVERNEQRAVGEAPTVGDCSSPLDAERSALLIEVRQMRTWQTNAVHQLRALIRWIRASREELDTNLASADARLKRWETEVQG